MWALSCVTSDPAAGEYFFEDWGKIAAVLGDAGSHDGPTQAFPQALGDQGAAWG